MRLVTFTVERRKIPRLGILLRDRDHIVDLRAAWRIIEGRPKHSAPRFLSNLQAFLLTGGRAWEIASQVEEWAMGVRGLPENVSYRISEIKLYPPITAPQKILAIGANYIDLCQEIGAEVPENPIVFAKLPSAVIGPGEPICWPPQLATQVDYEAELAFVVGKRAKNVPEDEAFSYIAGYTLLNDVTARDLQVADGQWTRSKSLDTFCPMGPWLVSADEIKDPHNLTIRCRVNGRLMQNSSTKNLIFDVPYLLSYLSRSFTLVPGDVIATGTPSGLGAYRNPSRFLQPGDFVEVEVEGIGVLSNPVGNGIQRGDTDESCYSR